LSPAGGQVLSHDGIRWWCWSPRWLSSLIWRRKFRRTNAEALAAHQAITCLVFIVILFAGVAPDVMRHSGLNWENNAAKQAVESGSHPATPNPDEPRRE
jgi:hypothetical protein